MYKLDEYLLISTQIKRWDDCKGVSLKKGKKKLPTSSTFKPLSLRI